MFHMPIFASSLLEIIRTLLDQAPNEEIQVLGCSSLANFINCQVLFMGDHSHMSMDFDKINSVTLENYMDINPANGEIMSPELHGSSLPTNSIINIKQELEPLVEASSNPCYWSRDCLHIMVGSAKEATEWLLVI